MAHIVVITGGLRSLFNASLTLCQQLVEAGHRVTYASPNALSDWLPQAIPFVRLPVWQAYAEAPSSRWEKLKHWRSRQHKAVAALEMDRFSEILKALNPDLLLMDIEMHPHIMTAVANDWPVALLCPFVSIWRTQNLPPIHTGIIPGRGWRGSQLGMTLSWWRYGWRKWKEAQRDRLQKVGCDRLSILRCYAKQINYPFRNSYGFSQWLVPYPHKRLPVLCLHGRELDFPHTPHPTMRYLGPMVSEHRIESVDAQDQNVLDKLAARAAQRALVYCGCSSMVRRNQQFLQRIVMTARSCPQWDFVLGLGGDSLSHLSEVPPNLYVLRWAPQLDLLKQADCAIIHAGIQSIEECIHCGVPMLLYPLNADDHKGNEARIRYHRLGIIDSVGSEQMENHLRELLSDLGYKRRLQKMRESLQHYAQDGTAICMIESLLNRHFINPITSDKSAVSPIPGGLP